MQLFQTVQEMQVQLNKVHETALQLAAEKEERQSHTDVTESTYSILELFSTFFQWPHSTLNHSMEMIVHRLCSNKSSF